MIANGHTMLMPEYASKVSRFLGVNINDLYGDEDAPTLKEEEVNTNQVDQSDAELRAFLEKELTGVYVRGTGDKSELREVVINEIVKYFKQHPEDDPRGKKPKE